MTPLMEACHDLLDLLDRDSVVTSVLSATFGACLLAEFGRCVAALRKEVEAEERAWEAAVEASHP